MNYLTIGLKKMTRSVEPSERRPRLIFSPSEYAAICDEAEAASRNTRDTRHASDNCLHSGRACALRCLDNGCALQEVLYRELISITTEVMERARRALRHTCEMRGTFCFGDRGAGSRDRPLVRAGRARDRSSAPFCTSRRASPHAAKIYTIFEPHTNLIKRGKVRTPT
jgi:hypothetical protein